MASRMDAQTNDEGTDHHLYRHGARGIDTSILHRPRLYSDQPKGLRLTIFALFLTVLVLGAVALSFSVSVFN